MVFLIDRSDDDYSIFLSMRSKWTRTYIYIPYMFHAVIFLPSRKNKFVYLKKKWYIYYVKEVN